MEPMTDHHAAFHAAIASAPDDPTPKELYADYLDDIGQWGEAEAWRWLAENDRLPEVNGWWPRSGKDADLFFNDRSRIPLAIYGRLPEDSKRVAHEGSPIEHFREFVAAFLAVLDRYTLADLVAKPRALTRLMVA